MTVDQQEDEPDMNPQPTRSDFDAALLLQIGLAVAFGSLIALIFGIRLFGDDFINLIFGG